MELSRTGEMGLRPVREGLGRRGVPSRGTSCHEMLPEDFRKQGLCSLSISLREQPAVPVIRVIKSGVSGF